MVARHFPAGFSRPLGFRCGTVWSPVCGEPGFYDAAGVHLLTLSEPAADTPDPKCELRGLLAGPFNAEGPSLFTCECKRGVCVAYYRWPPPFLGNKI